MKFKINLKEILEKKSISQYKLAQLTGLPISTIKRYYRDEPDSFHSQVLAKLCNALDCKIGELIIKE